METNELCLTCKKPLINGYCYNAECPEYDPLSQYFDAPSEEELAKDEAAIKARLANLDQPIDCDNKPF